MMDEKFLEFWGTLFLTAAKGKKQMDQMIQIMKSGFPDKNALESGAQLPIDNDIINMFTRLYGVDRMVLLTQDYGRFVQQTMADYQEAFNEFLSMMGMVSRKEHFELIEKYENLKEKCARQEETIRHLQFLLSARDGGSGDTLDSLAHVIKDQGELFQKMIDEFSGYLRKSDPQPKTGPNHQTDNEERKDNGTDTMD